MFLDLLTFYEYELIIQSYQKFFWLFKKLNQI